MTKIGMHYLQRSFAEFTEFNSSTAYHRILGAIGLHHVVINIAD